MKVILLQSVDRLGKQGEVVNVRDGYARNYLLPRKMAIQATDAHLRQIEKIRAQYASKEEKIKRKLEELADKLGLVSLKTSIRMGEEGAFGACLLVKTAFGPEIADGEIRAAVENGAGAVRAAFARVLEGAIARGELPSSVAPAPCAAFLYTVLSGLSALARTGARDQVAATLSHTFDTFPARPARRAKTRVSPRRRS